MAFGVVAPATVVGSVYVAPLGPLWVAACAAVASLPAWLACGLGCLDRRTRRRNSIHGASRDEDGGSVLFLRLTASLVELVADCRTAWHGERAENNRLFASARGGKPDGPPSGAAGVRLLAALRLAAAVAGRAEVRGEFTLLRVDRFDEPPGLRLLVFVVLLTDRVATAVLSLNHPILAIVGLRRRPGEQPQVDGAVNHGAITHRAPLLLQAGARISR